MLSLIENAPNKISILTLLCGISKYGVVLKKFSRYERLSEPVYTKHFFSDIFQAIILLTVSSNFCKITYGSINMENEDQS